MIPKKIQKQFYDAEGCMDLDSCYEQAVAELALQQSKRDQIIAFYLTILGFVIPNVIDLDIKAGAKTVAFVAMYAIGLIFCHVILRYRIYKEVYWIACRVITQLCNIIPSARNEKVIYTLFFRCLEKNRDSIVIKNKDNKNSILKSFKRQINSAETLLFETLLLFTTFVGCIGLLHLKEVSVIACVVGTAFVIYMLIKVNYKYVTRLMSLYKCVDTDNLDDLKETFKKAWMLHCFVDDIIDEEN